MEGLWYHGELAQLGKWLQGRDDRNGDTHLPGLVYKLIELLVVVEELGYSVCCAQLLLLQQVLHIHFQIRSFFVLLRIASHATAEFLARMLDRSPVAEETFVELVHLLQEVGCISMTILGRGEYSIILSLITAKYQDIADAQKLEIEQFVLNVFLADATADDVRNDRNIVLVLDGSCNGNGTRTSAYALARQQTVFQFLVNVFAVMCRNVDKPRGIILQAVDGAEQGCCSVTLEWRQNFERKASLITLIL